MDCLLNVDDSLIIEMVHVSLNLRCLRRSWMLIMYLDFIACWLLEVDHRVQLEVFIGN